MITKTKSTDKHLFDEHEVLHRLRHYLPAQAPLKDFVHHNTLHAFQDMPFNEACARASRLFGYKTTLHVDEFRELYSQKKIQHDMLEYVIRTHKGAAQLQPWLHLVLEKPYDVSLSKRTGKLRELWKSEYHFDMDSRSHPKVYRILNSYLDQGIATWRFPVMKMGFLDSLRELERKSYFSFFRTRAARKTLLETGCELPALLQRLVGDEALYEQYIYDQQFAHPGWSGMVSVLESQPESLLDQRPITLRELIALELLFEIDALDHHFKGKWIPLAHKVNLSPEDLFAPTHLTELDEVHQIWQEAYEWTYYDQVLGGMAMQASNGKAGRPPSFQALFCIDDRACSLRRHLEDLDPACGTFGTPGHFGLDSYYQPENGKFVTKVCPAPVKPKHLIKEVGRKDKTGRDAHFTGHSHSLFGGFLITHTLGFWSAARLMWSIFKPSMGPATASSFKHMDKASELILECSGTDHEEHGLQVGFTVEEMAARVENVLRSIGLVSDFAPVVYVIGHGSSSVNNTHYAAYDCGACSGRPGSVNARAFSAMANDPRVRNLLKKRDIRIPEGTQFIGGLHDTSRDEIVFYDENTLSVFNETLHERNLRVFGKALSLNAKERARRFELVDTQAPAEVVHERVKLRTVSLFEPRPELNHATNALCIVGRRGLTKHLYLDRRAFLNSYNYQVDPDGKYLEGILNAAAPVCGGINLEYYFSRVDNHKLGAGTKLPHNVMGLIGVANGIEGDLRTGLPSQMTEVHDPVRLLLVVEHFPEVVMQTIRRSPATWEWIANEWLRFAVVHPETHQVYVFSKGVLEPYKPITQRLEKMGDLEKLVESRSENLPVYFLN